MWLQAKLIQLSSALLAGPRCELKPVNHDKVFVGDFGCYSKTGLHTGEPVDGANIYSKLALSELHQSNLLIDLHNSYPKNISGIILERNISALEKITKCFKVDCLHMGLNCFVGEPAALWHW